MVSEITQCEFSSPRDGEQRMYDNSFRLGFSRDTKLSKQVYNNNHNNKIQIYMYTNLNLHVHKFKSTCAQIHAETFHCHHLVYMI